MKKINSMDTYELRDSPGGYKMCTKDDKRCFAYFSANDMIRTTVKDASGKLVLAFGGNGGGINRH